MDLNLASSDQEEDFVHPWAVVDEILPPVVDEILPPVVNVLPPVVDVLPLPPVVDVLPPVVDVLPPVPVPHSGPSDFVDFVTLADYEVVTKENPEAVSYDEEGSEGFVFVCNGVDVEPTAEPSSTSSPTTLTTADAAALNLEATTDDAATADDAIAALNLEVEHDSGSSLYFIEDHFGCSGFKDS